jgi:nicotinate-nucleotide adenylyltransferase
VGRSVGVLGGAFNPPHLGHLILAQEAIRELALDRLVIVPTGVAPHKRIEPEPGPEVRLGLARVAFADLDGADVSSVEVDRDGPSYAYRTLELLSDELQGSDLTFVMGADAAAGLEGWRRPQRVLELARIAIAQRPGVEAGVVERSLAGLGAPRGVETLRMPLIGVSSSMIRERIAAAAPIRWLAPDPVVAMIAERGLYREGVTA